MRWYWLLLFTAGCPEGTSSTDPDDDRIPDPFDSPFPYDPDCDGFEGTPVAGATGWFVGEFAIDGNSVEGHEVWALLANEAWENTGEGYDCKVVWNMAGVVEAPVNCASCEYSLVLDANLNYDASDCTPRLLQSEDQPFTVTYNVRELSTGETEFLYAESSRLLGVGTSDNDSANYVTDPRCFFF